MKLFVATVFLALSLTANAEWRGGPDAAPPLLPEINHGKHGHGGGRGKNGKRNPAQEAAYRACLFQNGLSISEARAGWVREERLPKDQRQIASHCEEVAEGQGGSGAAITLDPMQAQMMIACLQQRGITSDYAAQSSLAALNQCASQITGR